MTELELDGIRMFDAVMAAMETAQTAPDRTVLTTLPVFPFFFMDTSSLNQPVSSFKEHRFRFLTSAVYQQGGKRSVSAARIW